MRCYRISAVPCFLVGTFFIAGCIPATTPPTTEESYDIAILAGGATATQVSTGVYNIVLTDVHDNAISFTEAPGRTARTFTMEALVMWDKMFSNSPPNTVMYGRTPTDATIVVFEMGKPTYDAQNNTLTFQATLVGDSPAPQEVMNDVDLLIDPTAAQWINIAWNCGSAILNIIGAAIEDGVNPLEDVESVGASIDCINAIASASW
ncbi:MAG: hypothetical protein JXQ73_19890 [Phycisphaerae bacterium]|nr:hypothetical protein [Phycisphaerae bacterium]